ncbi:hypothetical protein V6N11_077011 [Hibiscus sabdariffa]|uniref:Phorbol-ester/DAG-type domain-containing protein n=1 Tax=Hibiscus sabdariffa TaxID=183260 RepID=A0ABR2TCM7_9ROSI
MEIQHVIHKHPLSVIQSGIEHFMCHACERFLSGPTYECEECRISFHKSCLDEHKPEVQNFFHPCPLVLSTGSGYKCYVCSERIRSGFCYKCKFSCHFQTHVKCALKPVVEYSDDEHTDTIQHFTHLHPLKPVDWNQQDEAVCNICRNLCSSSSSTTYFCMECKFFLHSSCIKSIPPRFINHRIHPCTLVFLIYPKYYRCDKCDDYEANRYGPFFSCGKCDFHLDVKCALLPTIDSKDAEEVQHFSHPHPLVLIRNHEEYGKEPRCAACVETCLAPTPTFRCSRSCNHFFLHKSCGLKFPHQPLKIDHPFHPKHGLAITSLPYNDHTRACGACCRGFDSSLIAYSCPVYDCSFNLHLDCTKLLPSFVFSGHSHLLTLFEKTPNFTCHLCGVNCNHFILRCVPCNFNIHLQCFPTAPSTIKHKSHLHYLILTKSPFKYELNSDEEAYNSDDEFYCDVCEEKRNKRELVYYCADCKFIAELKCVISTVLPLTPKSDSFEIIGEDNIVTEKAKPSTEIRNWHIEHVEQKLVRLGEREVKLKAELEKVEGERKDVIVEIDMARVLLATLKGDPPLDQDFEL